MTDAALTDRRVPRHDDPRTDALAKVGADSLEPIDPGGFADAVARYLADVCAELTAAMAARGYPKAVAEIWCKASGADLHLWLDRNRLSDGPAGFAPRFGDAKGTSCFSVYGCALSEAIQQAREAIRAAESPQDYAPWFTVEREPE